MKKIPDLTAVALSSVELARIVLDGKLTLENFRIQWLLEADKDRLLWRMLHEVEHFLIDEEIRAKDPKYDRYQRELIADLIRDVCKKYDIDEAS